ncbi:hypothetical protein HQ447_19180 [bacterium]|nr:hypothetical protein [bacterium]
MNPKTLGSATLDGSGIATLITSALTIGSNDLDTLGQATPTDDPDGDGVNNLLEYGLGGDPRVPSPSDLPTLSRTMAGQLIFTFKRARADLTYQVQATSDLLGTWQVLQTNPGTVGEIVTVTDTPPANVPQRFLRL